MILALIAGMVLAAADAPIVLAQGNLTPDGHRYHAVADTFVSATEPDANFGRDGGLSAGPQTMVLIRFGDLAAQIPDDRPIAEATLVLTRRSGDPKAIARAGLLRRSWGEGAGGRFKIPSGVTPKPDELITIGATWRQPLGPDGANWEQAGAKGLLDQAPLEGIALLVEGATVRVTGLASAMEAARQNPALATGIALSFTGDAEFASSESVSEGPRMAITLGEPLMTAQVLMPDLALVDLQPAGGDQWAAVVTNSGPAAAPAARIRFQENGRAVGEATVPALAPGASTTVALAGGSSGQVQDPRLRLMSAELVPDGMDQRRMNDAMATYVQGRSVRLVLPPTERDALEVTAHNAGFGSLSAWVHRVMSYGNDALLPASRFSFAPEGAKTRFRFAGWAEPNEPGAITLPTAIGLDRDVWFDAVMRHAVAPMSAVWEDRPNGSLPPLEGIPVEGAVAGWPGRLGHGDARDDRVWPRLLPLPAVPGGTAPGIDLPLEVTAPYSGLDIATLDAGWVPAGSSTWPNVILVRVTEAGGRPVDAGPGQAFRLEGDAWIPIGPFKVSTGGTINLPRSADGVSASGRTAPSIVALRIGQGPSARVALLTPAETLLAFHRSGRSVAIVPVVLAGPATPADRTRDWALNRIVAPVTVSALTDLSNLVDGQSSTTYEMVAGVAGSFEIDLGRDRAISVVELEGTNLAAGGAIRVEFGSTGDRATTRVKWTTVPDLGWAIRRYGVQSANGRIRLPLYGQLSRARYIRITTDGTKVPVILAGVQIYGPAGDAGGTTPAPGALKLM